MELKFLKNNKDLAVTFIKGYICGQSDAENMEPGTIELVTEDNQIPYLNIINKESNQYLKIKIHDLESKENNSILFKMEAESNVDSIKNDIESFNNENKKILITERDEISTINKFIDKICGTVNKIRLNYIL